MASRIREEEETKVMGVEPPKLQPASYLYSEEKKMFEKFVELHDHLSEADSEDLSQLCQYIVLHRKAVERIDELDILLDEYGKHLMQIVKLAKLRIEEKN
ncbi:hypothetical protein [Bacillus cereus]|uniref:hypothetical protein n=1 Tax=Bacillus cereus TaxID=1396 RepID=UPI0015D4D5FC|nr:hypothetical protein [Bacillus cereus]